MPTFKRGHHARETRAHNQRQLKLGSTTTTQPTIKARWWLLDPADHLTLRGIPAIGKNVQGAQPGTRPDTRDYDQPS